MTSGTGGEVAADPRLDAQWDRIRSRLQSELGEGEYRSWLRQACVGGLDGEELTLLLPTHFLRDWVRGQHGSRLSAAWQAENPAVRRVDVRVGTITPPPSASEPDSAMQAAANATAASSIPASARPAARGAEAAGRGGDLAASLDPRFTFANFVVGKPNEFAYACARRVAEQPACHGFNPLFLYGGVGLGKTHLMHAIAWDLPARAGGAGAAVAYMSAEKFMYRFIGAIRTQATMEFKEQLRGVDVLMIDDLQFLIG
ncbi:MAG TPA: DnaA/Hda family protein, partial [Acetobacteraceae bacterium]|nr:DnaA/Hda family protein [Acetobacteraceae bacterium]